ncbi:MAG: glycoside hydrolase family 15 protein [Actinomycetota bacterium]|nr:glycoside hydrolase family 15 protein [Actinomycetota bacterium]
MGYLPIEDHGVIGDLHTAALVGTDGTIDWLCLPRFDAPSVFASILDDEKGGHFKLRPLSYARSQQLYLPDANVLLTRFLSAEGVAEILDFMPIEDEPEERHDLLRSVRIIRGRMSFEMDCRPAFDYARQKHRIALGKSGAVFECADMRLGLTTEASLREGPARNALARFTLAEGEGVTFVLQQLKEEEGPGKVLSRAQFQDRLQHTLDYWRRWISKSTYQGRWREMVNRSALVLKLMVYDPTGALVAAPTMGLPETIGGERNWDYRYTWLRDAAFTLYALIRVGFNEEAHNFMGWLGSICRNSKGRLQPLYGIDGKAELHEEELAHLSGYRGSRPVRLGNAAYDQLQLDLYGAVLDAAYLHNKHGAPLDYDLWCNLRPILDWLSENWRQPDEGIWEVRGGRKPFVSSKVLSWVALDRGARIAHERGLPASEDLWIGQRNAIYEEVMEKGWDDERKSFVQYYGSRALDASLLLMPLVKFVGSTDPRWLATLNRIQDELAYDPLVFRYKGTEAADDGFSTSEEGRFSTCSFWLVECLTRAGRLEEARLTLEKMFSYANHLGLFAEEIGPSGEALGNFPQAFTHLALISAAVNLDQALG